MNNIYNKTMKKAVNLAIKCARKGGGKPFVPFYFVAIDKKTEDKFYFFIGEGYQSADFLDLEKGKYNLYLPYEPSSGLFLHQLLETINIAKIIIGVDNLEMPGAFEREAKALNFDIIRGVTSNETRQLNEVYIYNFTHKKPYIVLSFGMSLDGKIATKTGDSRYISSPESRVLVHELRDRYDAILVGINTIRVDHPTLTARLKNKTALDPIRVVLDSHLSINLEEPILHLSSATTLIVTLKNSNSAKKQALEQIGVEVIEVEQKDGKVSLEHAMAELYKRRINSIFVEGGSTVHFSFISQQLFNKIYAYISPLIIGGVSAPSAVGGEGFGYLKDAAQLDFISYKRLGKDLVVILSQARKD